LSNDWADPDDPRIALRCTYTGKLEPPSIRLSLPPGDGLGQLVLDVAPANASCPPLRKRYQIRARIDGTRITFTDPAGNRWRLTATEELLKGDVKWQPSAENPGEALAVGFTYRAPLRPWDVPLTRLFGTATLKRVDPAGSPLK
jgi:hypothetical protein